MLTLCPRSQYVLVTSDNGGIRLPAGCKAYACPVCGPAKVRERIRLAGWGASVAPQIRHLTLTHVPDEWQRARMQVRDYIRRLRKSFRIEMAWSIEKNPKGTGFHAHGITYGEYMPQKILQKMWGGRHVWINALPRDRAGYISKAYEIAGYVGKMNWEHLKINGGRAIHMTRGYLHGMRARDVIKLMSQGLRWRLELATEQEIAESWKETLTDEHRMDRLPIDKRLAAYDCIDVQSQLVSQNHREPGEEG